MVTGAAGGIGRAVALRLARDGAHVAVADVREGRAQSTAEAIAATGRHASAHSIDVADPAAWPAFVESVLGHHGHVDILVNNAGIAVLGDFADISPADARRQMEVNFWGVYNGCHFFLPHLLARPEAHIVNISSLFGLIGVPQNSLYCASKFAVRGLTESLMVELAETPVSLTSVHPGAVATDIARDAVYTGDERSHRRGMKAIANGISPEQAADIIVDGMRSRRERVLVGRDAQLMDRIVRWAPSSHRKLTGLLARRIFGRKAT